MSLLDAVRSILGIKPVKVGDIAATVFPSPPARRSPSPSATAESITDIEVIPEYEQVCALLDAHAPLLFVTGGAGTGKSTLIRYLRNILHSRIAVVAPTGVAALNARRGLHPPRNTSPAPGSSVCPRSLRWERARSPLHRRQLERRL